MHPFYPRERLAVCGYEQRYWARVWVGGGEFDKLRGPLGGSFLTAEEAALAVARYMRSDGCKRKRPPSASPPLSAAEAAKAAAAEGLALLRERPIDGTGRTAFGCASHAGHTGFVGVRRDPDSNPR